MEQKLLYKAIKSNNEEKILEACDLIYQKYQKLIYFIISKYITNVFDIEDLTQTVFTNFFNNLEKIDLTKNIKYYLVTSAKNISLNFIKKQNRMDYDDVLIYQTKDQNNNNYLYCDLINDLQKQLNKEQINIIILHTIEGYTFKEIAKKYNKKTNTIITIYNRALKQYKSRGDDYYER